MAKLWTRATIEGRPAEGGRILVEALDVEAAARHAAAWEDLAARGLEPNPFMGPAFCLAAARHLAPSASLVLLVAWEPGSAGGRRLIAVCPLAQPKPGAWPLAAIWFHDLAALGAPLLDRDAAEPALLAVLDWMARHRPAQSALTMMALDRDGPTARLLETVAARTERGLRFLDTRRRAVLSGAAGSRPAGLAALSRRRSKEALRQRRRLAERADLRYESATAPDALAQALGRFLALEARGWKGRAGTALASRPSRGRFAAEMVEGMGALGQCRIDALLLDGKPVAMGIVLASQDRQYFWKTAFAEDLGAFSPGVQFVLDLTKAQQGLDAVRLTDSCAAPDHPMIDRLWPDRLTLADAALQIAPGHGLRYRVALALEGLRRQWRAGAKRLYKGLVARRPGDRHASP